MKKTQEIKVENLDEENMFLVQSVHKLYAIEKECCKVIGINNKEINFILDSGAEINTLT